MKTRLAIALVMIAIVGIIVFFIPILFFPLLALVLGVATWEWCRITGIGGAASYYVAVASPVLWLLTWVYDILDILLWLSLCHYSYACWLLYRYEKCAQLKIADAYLVVIGPVLLSALAASMMAVFEPGSLMLSIGGNHRESDLSAWQNAMHVAFVVMVVAAADSGAYFAGRTFGQRQLAPKISPKKTWEGLIGGLVTVVVVVIFGHFLTDGWGISWWEALFIALIAALFSVVGDLFISMIKRQNGVKDSGNLLPGHGGVLDRIDGLMAAFPVFYIVKQLIA